MTVDTDELVELVLKGWKNRPVPTTPRAMARAAVSLVRAEVERDVAPLLEILWDLDRCEHGRHCGDPCAECQDRDMPSSGGSPWQWNTTWPGSRLISGPRPVAGQIGYGMGGTRTPIVIPRDRDAKRDWRAWYPNGRR